MPSETIDNKINCDTCSEATTELPSISSTESIQSVYSTLTELDSELRQLALQEIQEAAIEYEIQVAMLHEEFTLFDV